MIDGFKKLISDLRRELEKRGTLRVVSVNLIVDKDGKIIGRTEFKECMIFPRALAGQLEEGELAQIAEAISEG